jgi:hypothetical protein
MEADHTLKRVARSVAYGCFMALGVMGLALIAAKSSGLLRGRMWEAAPWLLFGLLVAVVTGAAALRTTARVQPADPLLLLLSVLLVVWIAFGAFSEFLWWLISIGYIVAGIWWFAHGRRMFHDA